MIKTSDEILRIFAGLLDDFPSVPIPKPPKPEELKPIETTKEKDDDEKNTPLLPIPIPIPPKDEWESKEPLSIRDKKPEDIRSQKQISIRDEKEKEPEHGSPEWQAKYHTHEFLRGVYVPWDRYYIDDPIRREEIVSKTMDKLVYDNPENYFEWRLYKKNDLKPWLIPSAVSLIEKDPLDALGKEIWRYGELGPLLKELWVAVFEHEIKRSVKDPQLGGQILPGILRKKIRALAGEIATADPEFYMTYIKGKSTDKSMGLTTKEFDEKAERVYKQKVQLGDIKEPSLPLENWNERNK
jgi:hypothetical protein